MAAPFARNETFTLLHRSNTVARTVGDDQSGRTFGWEYRGDRWEANRPADGEPPKDVTVTCSVCAEPIAFRVRSVAATRTLRSLLRWGAVVAAALFVLGIVLTASMVGISDDTSLPDEERDSAVVGVVTGVILAMVALAAAWTLVLKAGAQIGVTGGGAGAAGLAKHVVGRLGE